jgi:hypothetical protein
MKRKTLYILLGNPLEHKKRPFFGHARIWIPLLIVELIHVIPKKGNPLLSVPFKKGQ